MLLKKDSIAIFFAAVLGAQGALSEEFRYWERLEANAGAYLELGRSGNQGMNLQERTMAALTLEGLVGYRYDSKWLFGFDLNYQFHSQVTSLSDSGGTNLKGKAWMAGLGAQYAVNEMWSIQGALNFLGRYNFDKQTSTGQEDHLYAPLAVRVKGQYLLSPDWTGDINASYTRWSKFHVMGNDHSKDSNQWMLGVGITRHFRSGTSGSTP